jgi:NarL family two-component system response regulator LiaR
MDKIEVMLVEDHILVREGTKELLDREEDISVVAEAGDGEEAIWLANARHLDVIVMDIAMPKMDGLEATRRIKAINPRAAILVLTAYDDDEYILAFLEAGAAGYLLKDASVDDLIKGVRAVHAGESVLHPVVARKVIDHFRRTEKQRADEQKHGALGELTERELEVLKLAAKGMTNREIAVALSISPRTVQAHMSNIFGRLEVGSRTEAILYALREGWFSMENTA